MNITQRELQQSLTSALARHRVPGASVCVLRDGEVISAAAGVANLATGVELTPEAVMHIGSITKVFNATVVMQLVDERKVSLSEPIARYLPGLVLHEREAIEHITVAMLLNHTSGIDGNTLQDRGHDEETIEKGILRIAALSQIHAPGAEFSYSNAATVIAGYLAQHLTGKSWYQLIKERIFEPLQMRHAAVLPEEAVLYRTSVGHFLDSGQNLVRTSCAFLPLSFAPAGASLMMSAQNLIAFTQTHMLSGVGANGVRILSEHSARRMQETTVDNRDKGYAFTDGIGIGWMLNQDGVIVHAGGGAGISSIVYAHPEKGFAAAILTNAEHGSNLIAEIAQPWFDELQVRQPFGITPIHIPSPTPQVDYDRYVGVYENVVSRFYVTRTSQGLALSRQARYAHHQNVSLERTAPAALMPLGRDKFLLECKGSSVPHAADMFRLFEFRSSDSHGRKQHLGNSGRLYLRVV